MSALTDKDFYKVTVTAANVGKKFHVETHAGPTGSTTEADTVIDVLASDGLTSLGGPGSDFGVSETFTSTAIPAAGDYYIEVYSSVAFAADHPDYEVMISFE